MICIFTENNLYSHYYTLYPYKIMGIFLVHTAVSPDWVGHQWSRLWKNSPEAEQRR